MAGESTDKSEQGKDKQPTADDIKALQSTYDKKLADKDKELAELRKSTAKPVVDDDISRNEERQARDAAFAKEKSDFDTARVAWYREKTVQEYRLGDTDKKEIDKLTDPRDMELYALRKVASAKTGTAAGGADREPRQTQPGISASERLRSGLEERFKKLYPSS